MGRPVKLMRDADDTYDDSEYNGRLETYRWSWSLSPQDRLIAIAIDTAPLERCAPPALPLLM